jgi:hypothetical protein
VTTSPPTWSGAAVKVRVAPVMTRSVSATLPVTVISRGFQMITWAVAPSK